MLYAALAEVIESDRGTGSYGPIVRWIPGTINGCSASANNDTN